MKITVIIWGIICWCCLTAYAQSRGQYLFIGTYTQEKPRHGIYVYRLDESNGSLTYLTSGRDIVNPSYLTLSPDGRYLYACTETRMDGKGSLSAFSFNPDKGNLSFINKVPSEGDNPVYLTVDQTGGWLINGNYTGGSVAVHPLAANGSIQATRQLLQFRDSSINQDRQEASHIHATVFSGDHQFLFAPDLGADKIREFRFDPASNTPLTAYSEYKTRPGSGPRHICMSQRADQYAYCIEELSGTVTAYSYRHGNISEISTAKSYATSQTSYSSADIHASPDGRFLYTSNRAEENSIAIFNIEDGGKLRLLGHQSTMGIHPRNFIIDASGRYLLVANQFSNNIIVFKIDGHTGLLTYTGNQIKIPHPSCLQLRSY